MVDAAGTTVYGYSSGGFLASEDGPWDNHTISYTYANRLRSGLNLLCYGSFSGRTFGVIGIAWILGDWPQWHHKC